MLKLHTIVDKKIMEVKGYSVTCCPSYGRQNLTTIAEQFKGLVVDDNTGLKIFVTEPVYSDMRTYNHSLNAAVGTFENSQPKEDEQYRGFVIKDLFKVCSDKTVLSLNIAIPVLKENGSSVFTTRFESDIKKDFEDSLEDLLKHLHNLKPISFSDYINGAENEIIECEKGSEVDQSKQVQVPPEQIVKGTTPVTPVQQVPEQQPKEEEEAKAQEPTTQTQQESPEEVMKKQAKDTFACALYYRNNHPDSEYGLFDRSKVNITMGLNGLESLGINSVFKDYDMVLAKAAPDDPKLRRYYFEALAREFYNWYNKEKLERGKCSFLMQLDLVPVREDDGVLIPAMGPGFKPVAVYDSKAMMLNPLVGQADVVGRIFVYEKLEDGKHTIRFRFFVVEVEI